MRSVASEEDLAELPVGDAAAQLEQRGVEALHVADGGRHAGRLDGVDQAPRLGRGGGQRLLDQHGHPVGRELLDRRDVLLGGHRDDREVERPGREERADRAEDEVLVADGGEPVPVGIDGAGERRPRRGLQQPRVVAADHAQPEDGAARGALGRGRRHDGH